MTFSLKSLLGRFAPLIITLIVSGFFAFWIRDFVREVIVRPLLLFTWYATLILRSFPDSFYWIVFILIAVIIALRSLRRGQPVEKSRSAQSLVTGGPVSSWTRLVQHAGDGGYSQWQLSQALCKLTWDLLRDERSRSIRRIEEDLQARALDLPPDIQQYFEAGLLPYHPISKLKRRLGLADTTSALSLDPAEVVHFIETKLDPLTGERVTENIISGDR